MGEEVTQTLHNKLLILEFNAFYNSTSVVEFQARMFLPFYMTIGAYYYNVLQPPCVGYSVCNKHITIIY